MKLSDFLEQFGRETDTLNARLNDQGVCLLKIDEATEMTMETSEDENEIFFSALLCRYPDDEERHELFDLLMEVHSFGIATNGAYFSASRGAGKVILTKRLKAKTLDYAEFFESLQSFVDVYEYWKVKIEGTELVTNRQENVPTESGSQLDPVDRA